MDQLIEWIFGNIFIVVALVAGLLSLLQKANEKNQRQHKRPDRDPMPSPTPSGEIYRQPNSPEEMIPPHHNMATNEKEDVDSMETVYEQTQAQLGKVENRSRNTENANSHIALSGIHDGILHDSKAKNKKNLNVKNRPTRLRLDRHLDRNGLAESVIMAEVLGAPRARNPYRANRQVKNS
ncbi:hypothetical protein NC797_10455 [Aquibacillus sp. 3ASR75-11]|uniref:Uncharacterized protein n=1 Tax=Terrihalobacillus insolitus TaxID=2950438 RepID=A0A9X4AM56_9BACI|nr:hypothetical protein [Terrihalobacillus insolitus]MDC3413348.1 hypothetical protein [Terrihalobacillus insolitus]MDC3424931.1 hypothetical protein [Terrihalobacillus insolitus]